MVTILREESDCSRLKDAGMRPRFAQACGRLAWVLRGPIRLKDTILREGSDCSRTTLTIRVKASSTRPATATLHVNGGMASCEFVRDRASCDAPTRNALQRHSQSESKLPQHGVVMSCYNFRTRPRTSIKACKAPRALLMLLSSCGTMA